MDLTPFEPDDAAAWDTWLATNGSSSPGVWLVYRKLERNLTYAQALEAALRHGWIDSTIRRIDEARYQQRFTPRKSGSRWSTTNVEHVRRLLAQGRMEPAGLAVFPAELLDEGRARALREEEQARRNVEMPEDCLAFLREDEAARLTWDALAPSHRRRYAQWVMDARQEATRRKRLLEARELLSRGVKSMLK